ncbi:MAG: hypothetical protein ACM3QU_02565 [Verrucomicrobiota bacterium]
MSGPVAAGIVLALASAAALNWGFFVQHGAASALPPLSVRRPLTSLRLLFSDLRWLGGFVVGLAGWALYVAALALAPLSLVQAASAGGIGLLALLVERTARATLTRRDRLGVGAAVAGLVLLGISLAGSTAGGRTASTVFVVGWIVGSLAAAGVTALRIPGGAGFGIAAGLLYAAGDVATKAAVGGGAATAFAAAVLACHGLAFVALQLGFQRGGALATAGVSTLLTNALPILAGTILFHEGLPGGALGAVRVAAFAGVVAGAALLASTDARSQPEPRPREAPAPAPALRAAPSPRTID